MSINALTAHTCSALEISDELKVGDAGMKRWQKSSEGEEGTTCIAMPSCQIVDMPMKFLDGPQAVSFRITGYSLPAET
jgi:hypothetical protein